MAKLYRWIQGHVRAVNGVLAALVTDRRELLTLGLVAVGSLLAGWVMLRIGGLGMPTDPTDLADPTDPTDPAQPTDPAEPTDRRDAPVPESGGWPGRLDALETEVARTRRERRTRCTPAAQTQEETA